MTAEMHLYQILWQNNFPILMQLEYDKSTTQN